MLGLLFHEVICVVNIFQVNNTL